MKIGDEVHIHGFVDEIRKDIIIIRNKGGYFGTVAEEVRAEQTEPHEIEKIVWHKDYGWIEPELQKIVDDINRRVEIGIKESNARHIEDEPQTDCAWK